MKVTILNDIGACTSRQGEVDISYAELVEKLGEPSSDGDGYKVDAEWALEFEDGTIATIYNYKTGPNYNGDDYCKVEDIRDWHIGGRDKRAVQMVEALLLDGMLIVNMPLAH